MKSLEYSDDTDLNTEKQVNIAIEFREANLM